MALPSSCRVAVVASTHLQTVKTSWYGSANPTDRRCWSTSDSTAWTTSFRADFLQQMRALAKSFSLPQLWHLMDILSPGRFDRSFCTLVPVVFFSGLTFSPVVLGVLLLLQGLQCLVAVRERSVRSATSSMTSSDALWPPLFYIYLLLSAHLRTMYQVIICRFGHSLHR